MKRNDYYAIIVLNDFVSMQCSASSLLFTLKWSGMEFATELAIHGMYQIHTLIHENNCIEWIDRHAANHICLSFSFLGCSSFPSSLSPFLPLFLPRLSVISFLCLLHSIFLSLSSYLYSFYCVCVCVWLYIH